MEDNKVEIKLHKRLFYAGDVLTALLDVGYSLDAANTLLAGVETANEKITEEIDFWHSNCKSAERELDRLRAQLEMVYLIFGKGR